MLFLELVCKQCVGVDSSSQRSMASRMSSYRECIVYMIDDSFLTVPIKVSHIWSSMRYIIGMVVEGFRGYRALQRALFSGSWTFCMAAIY